MEEYAAGIVDGEGAIGISNRTATNSYHLLVQVSMKLPTEIPKWLYDNFGGHYGEYKQSRKAYGDGYIAKWSIHGTEAQGFLNLIKPHLKDKAGLAELALVFPIATKKHKAEKEIQEAVYNRMKELNS